MRHGQFHRIRRLPRYVFGEVNAMKAAARAVGHDIIDFGMGNPDGATPQPIVEKLIEAFVAENRTRYRERRDVLVEGLQGIGWPVAAPAASMFVWARIPARYRALGSLEFSKLLLREARVAVAPGLGFGEYGEGFVRFALVENRQRIRQAVRNIKTFLGRSAPDRARAVA